MVKFSIWYMRPEYFQDGILGHNFCAKYDRLPSKGNLSKTHIHLTDVELPGKEIRLDSIYVQMQGEVWSPNGEARGLIEAKGLAHTSMSVGDIIVGNGETYMVDNYGFVVL